VKVWNTIVKGREDAVQDINIDEPMEDNNQKLVHVRGITSTSIGIVDPIFDIN